MSTTNLFVELIVIGVGTFIWILLLLSAMFGWELGTLVSLVPLETAVPLVSLVYVLGIAMDRLADVTFETLWGKSLRKSRFGELRNYYDARRQILTKSERLSELLEYGRSRLRICRGWT